MSDTGFGGWHGRYFQSYGGPSTGMLNSWMVYVVVHPFKVDNIGLFSLGVFVCDHLFVGSKVLKPKEIRTGKI